MPTTSAVTRRKRSASPRNRIAITVVMIGRGKFQRRGLAPTAPSTKATNKIIIDTACNDAARRMQSRPRRRNRCDAEPNDHRQLDQQPEHGAEERDLDRRHRARQPANDRVGRRETKRRGQDANHAHDSGPRANHGAPSLGARAAVVSSRWSIPYPLRPFHRHRRNARRCSATAVTSPGAILATVLYLALKLERPLFVEGEPGTGKTEIAKVFERDIRTPPDPPAVLRRPRRFIRRVRVELRRPDDGDPSGRTARPTRSQHHRE